MMKVINLNLKNKYDMIKGYDWDWDDLFCEGCGRGKRQCKCKKNEHIETLLMMIFVIIAYITLFGILILLS